MSNNQDDLLKDLERRANESKNKNISVDDGPEDIEAFLKEQEGDDYVPPVEEEPNKSNEKEVIVETKPRTSTPKSTIKEPQILEKPVGDLEKPAVDPRTKRKTGSKVAKPVERGESKGLKIFVFCVKYTFFCLPILLAAWLVGAWLGSWIGTGWLLAIIGLLGVLVPGLIVYLIVRKGRVIWWMTAFSVVFLAVFLGLFPTISAESLVRHGHWPLTAVLQPMGVSPDNFATRGMDSMDEKIASLLSPAHDPIVPTQLGSAEPLIPSTDTAVDENNPN